jgi:catechol 2,3-dioxygenase-like lactoylglutathione lyase family enzyme
MEILAYEHVGTRVSDRGEALAFYEALGFRVESEDGDAIELINAHGVRINLIVNAAPDPDKRNVLLDDPVKRAGHTHPAFVVARLDDVAAWADARGVRVTEGPKVADRRRYLFIRDPDGNVLEFNELTPRGPSPA